MSWSIINIVMFLYFQEEQNFNKGVKHTSWRFNWPILSNGILADLPHTVFCLPVEAKYVILEKSSVYCCQILLYNSDRPVVWNNVLGCRQKKVMIINKKKGSRELWMSNFLQFYRGYLWSPFVTNLHAVDWSYCTLAGIINRICSMPWAPCMPRLFSWEYRILVQFSQLYQLSGQSFTGKGQLTCTHLCHMHWDR